MQAASIALLTTVVNGADPAADQAPQGQDIRINAAQGLNGCDTLFTAILRRGFAGEALPGAAADGMLQAGAAAETAEGAEAADAADQADADALDVCSLLVQLMLASGQPAQPAAAAASDESAAEAPAVVAAVAPDTAAAPDTAGAPDTAAAPDTTALPAAAGIAVNGAASPKKPGFAGDTAPAAFDPAAVMPPETAGEAQAPPEVPVPSDRTGGPGSAAGAEGNLVLRSIAAALENAVTRDVSESGGAAENAADAGARNTGAAAGSMDVPVKAERPDAGEKPADAEPEERDGGGAEDGLPAQTAAAPIDISAGEGGGSSGEITAAVEKALDRFARELRSFGGTARELRIVLEPESLGVLTISVVKTETGVSAKIKSEDKDVAAAISENLQKLITTMENRGIRLDDVDVSYARPDQSAGFGRQGFGRGGDGAPGGRYAPASGRNQEEDAAEDFWREYYGGISGGDAAVDYRI